jgi:hypothetical protein
MSTNIRIVRKPIGDAPDWVREAWVCLELPSARKQPANFRGVSVLDAPSWLTAVQVLLGLACQRRHGYLVPAMRAFELLSQQNESAAAWWRQHTPHLTRRGKYLLFDDQACERVNPD